MLDEYVVDVCSECKGEGQVGAKGERIWCRRCGGNGTELMYKQLVPCPECIGDGNCMVCVGEGSVDTE